MGFMPIFSSIGLIGRLALFCVYFDRTNNKHDESIHFKTIEEYAFQKEIRFNISSKKLKIYKLLLRATRYLNGKISIKELEKALLTKWGKSLRTFTALLQFAHQVYAPMADSTEVKTEYL